MEQCVVLGARRYDFQDEQKRRVEGVTLTYLTGDVEQEADRRGLAPMSISAPATIWPDLAALPGLYDLDFKQRPGKNGRPALQVVGVRFIAPVDVLSTDGAKAKV